MRNWNWLNVDCLTEILQVKCFGGFISYLVNREAYLVIECWLPYEKFVSKMCWRICGSSVKNETDFKAGYVSGLENVIFLWQSRISGEKKHLVLLISQKDYEHIKKYVIWDRD